MLKENLMNKIFYIEILIFAVLALVAGSSWLLKLVLQNSIEKKIAHRFNAELETLKSKQREQEEALKASIRAREADVSMLRSVVLEGRSERVAWLEKRRLEALDRIWGAVVALAPYKVVAGTMASIKFEAAAKEAPTNAGLRTMIGVFTKAAPKELPQDASVAKERPYVSPLLWAYFSAYQAILLGAWTRAKFLEAGIESPEKFLKMDYDAKLVAKVLPHYEKFLSDHGPGAGYHLIEEIEEAILKLLRDEVQGTELDQVEVKRASEIMKAVKEVTATRES